MVLCLRRVFHRRAIKYLGVLEHERDRLPTLPPRGTVLCGIGDIEDGDARVISFDGGFPAAEIIVVRRGASVCAYLNVCAHLPLPLNIGSRVRAKDGLMFCDHHYAAFRLDDGVCVDGACRGERLTAVPLAVVQDRVTIA